MHQHPRQISYFVLLQKDQHKTMNKAIAFLKKMITQIPVPVKFLTFIKIDISSVNQRKSEQNSQITQAKPRLVFLYKQTVMRLNFCHFILPSYAQNWSPGIQTLYFWRPFLLKKYQKAQVPCIPPF